MLDFDHAVERAVDWVLGACMMVRRQAVLEARSQGVHPFCITIDDEAQGYLPHMFGAASYTVVENVAKLPYRVSDIYRRITV